MNLPMIHLCKGTSYPVVPVVERHEGNTHSFACCPVSLVRCWHGRPIKGLESRHCIFAQFVSVSAKINHNTYGCWTPTRMCAVTTPLHSLYGLDRQSQPSRRGCHNWELQNQPLAFCRQVLILLASSQQSFNMHRSVFCCVPPGGNEI